MKPVKGGAAEASARRLAGNALWLVAAEVVSKVASLVFVVIVARAIGVREYGYFTFATSFVPLFLVFGSLGLHAAVVRGISRDRTRLAEVFVSGLWMRLVTGVLALALSVLLAPSFLDSPDAVWTVGVVGTALLIDAVASYMSAVFEAYERMRYYATALIVNRIGSTALALVALLAGGGLTAIFLTYLAGSLASLVYVVRALRRHFPPMSLRAGRRSTAGRLLRQGAPLGIAAILNMALFQLDTVMVAAYLGPEAVGLYGVAFRFFESFLFVAFALGDVTFPRYAKQGPGALSERTFSGAAALSLAFYVPLFVLSLFAAPWMVSTIFGDRYVEAADAVPWLTLATIAYAVTYQARTSSVGVGGRSSVAGIAAVALTVNVALNLVLIPRYGFSGAAMATAFASTLETVLTLVGLRRLGVPARPTRLMAIPFLAGGVAAALLLGLDLRDLSALLVGAGTYAAVLAVGAVLGLAPQDKAFVVSLLRRRPPPADPAEPAEAAEVKDP